MLRQSAIFSIFRKGVMFFLLSSQTLKATTQELVALGDLEMRKVSLSVGFRYICTQDVGFVGDGIGFATRSKLKRIYAAADAEKNLQLDLFPGGHGWSGNKAVAFFRKHLV